MKRKSTKQNKTNFVFLFFFFMLFIVIYVLFGLYLTKPKLVKTSTQASSSQKPKAIIGGHNAEAGAWPFMVLIYDKRLLKKLPTPTPANNFFNLLKKAKKTAENYSLSEARVCGGALISPDWVVSAGHCFLYFDTTNPVDIGVAIGFYDLAKSTNPKRGKYLEDVEEVIASPFTGADIAFVKLKKPVTSPAIKTISFTDDLSLFATGRKTKVAGWGENVKNEENKLPTILQELDLEIIPNGSVTPYGRYSAGGGFGNNFVIAQAPNQGTACYGDSGSPLITYDEKKDKWVLIGIVSGGGCDGFSMGDANSYLVFTKINASLWNIKTHTNIGPNEGTFVGKEPKYNIYLPLINK